MRKGLRPFLAVHGSIYGRLYIFSKLDIFIRGSIMKTEEDVLKMESIVQDHEQRILELEKNYSEVQKEITIVQTSQSKIENMLYKQNTEQKELIDKHQKEQRVLLDTLLGHTLGIKKES